MIYVERIGIVMLSEANRKAHGDIKLNTSFFRTSLAGAGGGTGLALTRQNTRKERMRVI